eukprot:2587850-Pyramimonas_sp.AAC.1
MELAWLNGMLDCAMPFMIQFMREYSHKVDVLVKDKKEREEEATNQVRAKRKRPIVSLSVHT